MRIVLEGIDKVGKSTLSKELVKLLNKDTLEGYTWTKEPTFSTEEADALNSPEYKDAVKRESLFFMSRSRHQDVMRLKNVVCDRYIWTGISYAMIFSPQCYEFAKELYLSELFVKPDLHIFLDADPEICFSRDNSLDIGLLHRLRESFLYNQKFMPYPCITISLLDINNIPPIDNMLDKIILEAKNMGLTV